jgi:hypothetical protein
MGNERPHPSATSANDRSASVLGHIITFVDATSCVFLVLALAYVEIKFSLGDFIKYKKWEP